MANRITTIIDFVTDGASRQLSGFKAKIAEADTATGKMKAGFGAAGDFIKSNAASIATTAGAALVGFGIQSVKAFNDIAIEAGKFADATGLAVEDASRWIEVAGDVGVSAETTSGLFVRLNKAIGDGAPVVAQLGIEQKKLADGTTDVNATMVEAIRKLNEIKDPTERAAAAQKLFGRGYKEAAEIIFTSADGLVNKLGEVADAKVIDEDELAKARDFREAMDNLKDSFEEISLVIGEQLTPVVSDAADHLLTLKSAAELVPDPLKDAANFARNFVDPLYGIKNAADGVKDSLGGAEIATESVGSEQQQVTAAVHAAIAATDTHSESLDLQAQYHEVGAATAAAHEQALADEKAQIDRNVATTQRLTDEYKDQRDAADDLLRAKTQLVGGEIAVRQAQREAKTAADELNTAIAEGTIEFSELGPALDDVTTKQMAAAQAAAQLEADQLRANGSTVDAQTEAYLYKQELQKLADQATGPTRDALLALIAQLDEAARHREGSVNIVVTANGRKINVGEGLAIGIGGSATFSADGNYNTPGGMNVINDGNGGELVTLPNGSKVMTAANTENYLDQMGGGAAPTVVNNKTINLNQFIEMSSADPGDVLYEAARRARYME